MYAQMVLGKPQSLVGHAESLEGEASAVEVFSPEIVKGVLPSRHTASDIQTGVPYFLRLTAANSLGFGEYGEDVSTTKAAQSPESPDNLVAGVALHVDEVGIIVIAVSDLLRNNPQAKGTTVSGETSTSSNILAKYRLLRLVRYRAASNR